MGAWCLTAFSNPIGAAVAADLLDSPRLARPLGAEGRPGRLLQFSNLAKRCMAALGALRCGPASRADPDAVLRFLLEPPRWPDMASAGGRFTSLRAGGLHGNTFESEVVAAPVERTPVFTRGYVTCTGLHRGAGDLEGAVRRVTGAEPEALPPAPRRSLWSS